MPCWYYGENELAPHVVFGCIVASLLLPILSWQPVCWPLSPGFRIRMRLHALKELALLKTCRLFVVVFVWRLSGAFQLPCVLILHERSGPRSVSNCLQIEDFVATCLVDINPLATTIPYMGSGIHVIPTLLYCFNPTVWLFEHVKGTHYSVKKMLLSYFRVAHLSGSSHLHDHAMFWVQP